MLRKDFIMINIISKPIEFEAELNKYKFLIKHLLVINMKIKNFFQMKQQKIKLLEYLIYIIKVIHIKQLVIFITKKKTMACHYESSVF